MEIRLKITLHYFIYAGVRLDYEEFGKRMRLNPEVAYFYLSSPERGKSVAHRKTTNPCRNGKAFRAVLLKRKESRSRD